MAIEEPWQGTDIHHDGMSVFHMGEGQHQYQEGCFGSILGMTQMTRTIRKISCLYGKDN
jgi:hypothetical protein